tara:strand:- start:105 stop:1160 length:1056 start_codon:yes stop_codon:yes gene_type:complete
MKNFNTVFVITLLLFFFINLAISLTWPIYSKYKTKSHEYISEQINELDLSEEDLNILYDETWRNYDKFTYVPFLGHSETKRVGKFVNFDQKKGRKVERPKNCNQNVYLYGGSTMFGYNVVDDETIAQHLQNSLGDNYCVFNQGRAYFYSKQENNLFSQQIENDHKIDFAIFLDGINERCGGYEYDDHINRSFSILVERPYKMWKKTSLNFIYTLPIIQFTNSFFNKKRWIVDEDNNILQIESCKNKVPLDALFQKRVNLRHALCNEEKIICFTFFQPFAGVHGVQIEKLLYKRDEIALVKKYKILRNAKKYIIDIGDVISDDKSLSYIDEVHYTPKSNNKIAQRIYTYLIN